MADNPFDETNSNETGNETESENMDTLFEDGAGSTSPKPQSANRNFIIAIAVLGTIFLITVIALIVFSVLVLPARNAQRQSQATQVAGQKTMLAKTQLAIALEPTQTLATIVTNTNTPGAVKATATQAASATQPNIKPTETMITSAATEVIASSDTPVPTVAGTTPALQPMSDQERTETMSVLYTQLAGGGQTGTVVPAQTGTTGSTVVVNPEAMTSTAKAATVSPTPGASTTALPNTGIADDMRLPLLFGAAVILVVIIFLVRRVRLSSN